MWYARPCPLPLLKVMALGVIHLQPLRLVLLDAMMTEYLDRVDSYLSNSLTEPGAVGHITMVRSYTRRLFTRGAALLNVCMVCIRDGHE